MDHEEPMMATEETEAPSRHEEERKNGDTEAQPALDTAPEASPPSGGLKRKKSPTPEPQSKRARMSPAQEDAPTQEDTRENQGRRESQDATAAPSTRKGPGAQDGARSQRSMELPKRTRQPMDAKERNKRLFGGALGVMAGKSTDKQSRLRQEHDARKKAEKERKEALEAEQRAANYEKLKVHRRREQIKVDEEVMQTRHRRLLNSANSLWTETEPRLAYRPYELSLEQEEKIAEQIEEAQRIVDEELVVFESRKIDAAADLEEDMNGGEAIDGKGGEAMALGGGSRGGTVNADSMAKGLNNGGTETSRATEPASAANGDANSASFKDMSLSAGTDSAAATAPGDVAVSEGTETKNAFGPDGPPTKQDDKEAEDNPEHVYEGDEDTLIY